MAEPPVKFKAKCPKCATEYTSPPKGWDCVQCQTKTWQPDDDSSSCIVCETTVAKFSRHHCRMCGYVTCAACTKFLVFIPEWGNEKQKVCRKCATPESAKTMEGFLNKQGGKTFFGEKMQRRWFELRGMSLLYGTEPSTGMKGAINLEDVKVMEVASHANGFLLSGPKLQRGYVLSAEDAVSKRRWMDAIAAASSRGKQLAGHSAEADELDDDLTEDVLFSIEGPAATKKSIGMADFDLLTVLGLGSFGRVMKVREKKSGRIFAMKVLDKAQVVANKMVKHTHDEKDILGSIDHPFICKMYHAFQTRKHLVLILDFLCGGELFFHLQRCRRFPESRAKFYAAEIGTALEHIHKRDIIYRDLKPENLVLNRMGHVTLTDFGLAKREVHDMTHTFCGTPEYMAPELIQKRGHTKAVDWWSLGIFLFEMVGGLPPFYNQNVTEMYDMILHRPLAFPKHFSPDLQHLLGRLLDRNPETRLQTGEEYRKHPFFRDVDFAKLLRLEIVPEFVPDVSMNDLRYFDKQFTQESVSMPTLDMPHDPNDPNQRFNKFEFNKQDLTGAAAEAEAMARIDAEADELPVRRAAPALRPEDDDTL
jgi:serine/threonine protein kinase